MSSDVIYRSPIAYQSNWRERLARWILKRLFGDAGSISWNYNWNGKYDKLQAYNRTDEALGVRSNINEDYQLQQREREIARKFIDNLPKYRPEVS